MYFTTVRIFEQQFSVWGSLTFDMVKIEKFQLFSQTKKNCVSNTNESQNFSFLTMSKVEMGQILSKKEKGCHVKIIQMLLSTWPTTRILIKSVGDNSNYFHFEPKTEIGCLNLKNKEKSPQ